MPDAEPLSTTKAKRAGRLSVTPDIIPVAERGSQFGEGAKLVPFVIGDETPAIFTMRRHEP
jgi:hypothetical protein